MKIVLRSLAVQQLLVLGSPRTSNSHLTASLALSSTPFGWLRTNMPLVCFGGTPKLRTQIVAVLCASDTHAAYHV